MFKSLKPEGDCREQLKIARQQIQVLQKCLADKCDESERIQTKVEILRKSLSQVVSESYTVVICFTDAMATTGV